MLFHVDESSSVSLAEQIAVQVRAAIVSGGLAAGERLPPARELSAALRINMHTVLRAYAQLRDDELIEMRQGRGAWVRNDVADSSVRLGELAAQLVTEAKKLGYSSRDLLAKIEKAMG